MNLRNESEPIGGWPRVPLKHASRINPEVLSEDTPSGTEIEYVDIAALEGGAAADLTPKELTFAAAPSRARRVLRSGDTIISTVRTYLRAVANFPFVDSNLIASTGFAVLRPNGTLHPRFAYWAVLSEGFIQSVVAHSEGVSYPAISPTSLGQLPLTVPPLQLQERIANFLDEKTARIDALIAEKETLLTSLEEFHRSTLWSLVTKGGSSKNLTDSGVEWIGDAPVSWKITAIKWMTPVLRGASPRPIDDPKYFDEQGEYGWVRIADVSASDGFLLSTEQRLSKLGESLSVKREPGDLFLSIAGTVGKPCIAGIKCCIHDGFVWFPAIDSNALRGWLFAIFESGFAYAGLGKMGTQLNLNTDTVGSIRVPVPPVEEMLRLLERARKAKAANLALQAHIQRHIDRLREYRSSLISAAVTGQLNIDDFQARQLEAA